MKIRPLHNWAVIRPDQKKEQSAGGLFIPDAAKVKAQIGEVLSIGPGRMKEEKDKKGKMIEKKFEATVVKAGNRVFYDKYVGNKVEVDGEDLLIVREDDILGLVE